MIKGVKQAQHTFVICSCFWAATRFSLSRSTRRFFATFIITCELGWDSTCTKSWDHHHLPVKTPLYMHTDIYCHYLPVKLTLYMTLTDSRHLLVKLTLYTHTDISCHYLQVEQCSTCTLTPDYIHDLPVSWNLTCILTQLVISCQWSQHFTCTLTHLAITCKLSRHTTCTLTHSVIICKLS